MKKTNLILIIIAIMAFGSCAVEEPTMGSNPSTEASSKFEQTPEMQKFRETLIEIGRANVVAQHDGNSTSLFDKENSDLMATNARALLLTSGHSEGELKNLDNKILFIKALRQYAELTQIKSNN